MIPKNESSNRQAGITFPKTQEPENFDEEVKFLVSAWLRVGESRRRLMHLVPAPAVRLMKRRVQSRPGLRQENRP